METEELLKRIEEKIAENGKLAGYSNIKISEEPSVGKVGIWWYAKGRVFKIEDDIENCEPDDMICVNQEHNRSYPFFQKQYSREIPELLELRFDQIERGRVWLTKDILDSAKTKFMITCSTTTSQNPEAIQAIKNSFGLNGKVVGIQAQPAMYDRQIALK